MKPELNINKLKRPTTNNLLSSGLACFYLPEFRYSTKLGTNLNYYRLYLDPNPSYQDYYSMTMPLQQNSSPAPDTVVSSSFRDHLMFNFHQKVFKDKLNVTSVEKGFNIEGESFNKILSQLNPLYHTVGSYDVTYEGFISDHTFVRLSHDHDDKNHSVQSYFTTDKDLLNFFQTELKIIKAPPYISWVTHMSQDGLEVERIPLDAPEVVKSCFYPWLNGIELDDYLQSYLDSSESILLLYGKPGTGKSNLLKYLLQFSGECALITYQDSVRDLDLMFSSFLKGPEKFLIIEDADEFLIKREQGNTAMKRLLNITDGLTSNKDKKVIFTTNLTNTSSIDPALRREGRCYDQVAFDSYTEKEALLVAESLGIPPESLVKPDYTLAELFSLKNAVTKPRRIRNETTKFGFGN